MSAEQPKYRASFLRNTAGEPADQAAVREVLRLRKRIFVEQAGWDLPCSGDLEADAYDTPYADYCALFVDHTLTGCFRAIRTDRPYLSADVFPQLAQTHAYPRSTDIYEITRFGVLSGPNQTQHARHLYAMMFAYAQQQNARALVAVADLTYERFLRGLGVRTARYGPPQIAGRTTDGAPIEVVAGEIPLQRQTGHRFRELLSLINNVEMEDASHVFRHRRLSA